MSVIEVEEITVSNSVVPLTAAKINKQARQQAVRARVQVQAQPIRYFLDGQTPSTTSGARAIADGVFWIEGADALRNFKAIREGSSDAKIVVEYYGV